MPYIRRIEIDALWKERHHVVWELHPGVNILSGVNGVGKSTILRRLVEQLHTFHTTGEFLAEEQLSHGVSVEFFPENVRGMKYDIVHPYAPTELNTKLHEMQESFTAFYSDPDRQESLLVDFYDALDSLFVDTEKTIVRDVDRLLFMQDGEPLVSDLLSSGEKHILILLVALLCQRREPYVIIMDEPEYSLHFDWQKRLLSIVTKMNPEAQIILTTHSPAVVMDGWTDCVTDVEDIVDNRR